MERLRIIHFYQADSEVLDDLKEKQTASLVASMIIRGRPRLDRESNLIVRIVSILVPMRSSLNAQVGQIQEQKRGNKQICHTEARTIFVVAYSYQPHFCCASPSNRSLRRGIRSEQVKEKANTVDAKTPDTCARSHQFTSSNYCLPSLSMPLRTPTSTILSE